MFSTGEKAVDLLRAYIERKAKEGQNTVHWSHISVRINA
jgi:hypothetical protein